MTCEFCGGRGEVGVFDFGEGGYRNEPCICPPPEIYQDCPQCNGEGAIEQWESVSRWSIDPPCAIMIPCDRCNGAGGYICEAESDV